MNKNPSPQAKPDASSPGEPVQTGALSGGQPGQGVNTSPSPAGKSNVDAAAAQGVEYGEHEKPRR